MAARPGGSELTFPYDSVIVAPGAATSYFGRADLAEHSLPMKTVDDALNLRRRIFAAFELAETAPSEAERRRWLTFAVVGGGPTGYEVAAQIAEFHGLRYGGFVGFLSWLFIHLAFITGFRNRVGAMVAWSWAFIGRSHNQRTFTVESVGGSDIYRGFAPPGAPER